MTSSAAKTLITLSAITLARKSFIMGISTFESRSRNGPEFHCNLLKYKYDHAASDHDVGVI